MSEQEQKAAMHLYFELIASFWRQWNADPFVPRESLVHQLSLRTFEETDHPLTEEESIMRMVAQGGMRNFADYFAMSGPDEDVFQEVAKACGDPGLEAYWRYKVKRGSVVGYVRKEELTDSEREKIAERLKVEGDKVIRRAESLERGLRTKRGTR
jgi:hypothetical protein